MKQKSSSSSQAKSPALAEIDFSTFIISLATSAQLHLGELSHEIDAMKEKGILKDLPQDFQPSLDEAQQTIDILGMLVDKTKGNLTAPEAELLKNMLYDLRVAFVRQKDRLAKKR